MQLVIAEKPSVAQDYARALGGGFQKHEGYLESDEHIVSWAIGHLVELAEPEEYDEALKRWSIKTLPVLPEQFKLRPDARNKKQLDVLKRLIKRDDVDEIVNGCDAGREGELIFQYIMDVAKTKKPVRRLWVSSMTKDAIREGFENLRPGEEMEPLAAAARSRSEADWLVGMNATRAATVKGRSLGGVVSLGRVQTPTLALIVRRDLEIDAFEPQTYFQVDARFGLDGPRTYTGRWFEGKEDRTSERDVADAVAAAAGGADALVATVKRTERKTRSPLLYDLTSLQRDANSRYGLSAQRTLAAAQRLYEGSTAGALLTYPRTRSQFLPSDQIPTLKATARSLTAIPAVRAAAEYVAGLDVLPLARVVNDAKVDDHHAIVPTGELPRKELTGDDARVFDLVVRRFLAVFHPDAKFEDTEIVTEAGGHRFRTRGRRLIEAGWRAAAFGEEAAAEEPPAGDDDEPRQSLPKVEEGERGTCESAEVLEKQTKPPPRYSEASLLKDMETAGKQIEDEELRQAMKEAGLGTPATRAETIEKLIRVSYIERLGKQLRATSKGRQAIALLGDHALTSADLTGRWEKRLSDIEHGAGARDAFMDDIRDVHVGDGRVLPRALLRRRARAPRGDRPVPELRRHHPREPARLRLLVLEEPRGARLRLRHLEAAEGPLDLGRRGPGAAPEGPDRAPGRVQDPAEQGAAGARRGKPGAAHRRRRHPPRRSRRAAREDRRLPEVRRRDPREQPRLRVLVVEEQEGDRLRLRHLEVDQGPPDLDRRGPPGDRERRVGLDGLQGSQGTVPRAARPDA